MWSWTERGLDQLASLCRDVERMNTVSTYATTADAELTPPRVRVNVKRLANGQWQPDITLECFDCDPLYLDQERVIRDRLDNLKRMVDARIAEWREDEGDA